MGRVSASGTGEREADWGSSVVSNGVGVRGSSGPGGDGIGVEGESTEGYAGVFRGKVVITGDL